MGVAVRIATRRGLDNPRVIGTRRTRRRVHHARVVISKGKQIPSHIDLSTHTLGAPFVISRGSVYVGCWGPICLAHATIFVSPSFRSCLVLYQSRSMDFWTVQYAFFTSPGRASWNTGLNSDPIASKSRLHALSIETVSSLPTLIIWPLAFDANPAFAIAGVTSSM